MNYRYWFSIVLLATILTGSAVILSVCIHDSCNGFTVGMKVAQIAQENKGMAVLLVLMFFFLIVLISILILSMFLYLKRRHTLKLA